MTTILALIVFTFGFTLLFSGIRLLVDDTYLQRMQQVRWKPKAGEADPDWSPKEARIFDKYVTGAQLTVSGALGMLLAALLFFDYLP